MWDKVVEFVDKNHPEKVTTGRASGLINKTCLTQFRNILKGRELEWINGILIIFDGENCFQIRAL